MTSIRLDDITVTFGDKTVLDHLSTELPGCGIIALFGPSGSGKTTLLDVLCGLITPQTGRVMGRDGRPIARVFQDNRFIPWASSLENVRCVVTKAALGRIDGDDAFRNALGLTAPSTPDAVASTLLSMVGLGHELQAPPTSLSGGMQKRLGIARALAADAEIVVLDEPTVGLDEEAEVALLDTAMALWRNRLVLFVTHDRALAERYADEIRDVTGPPLTLGR